MKYGSAPRSMSKSGSSDLISPSDAEIVVSDAATSPRSCGGYAVEGDRPYEYH